MASPPPVRLKRIYQPPLAGDGQRILIDGMWPRGVRKADAAVDHWLREIAPSAALRTWYRHAEARWPTFRARYHQELEERPEAVARLAALIAERPSTLLFATRAADISNAAALLAYLVERGLATPA